MGKAFKEKRNEIVLGTKCRHMRNNDGLLPENSDIKNFIELSLSESLEALQADYVDVFMLHQVDMEILDNEEIAETFLRLKKEGRIKATGASTYTNEETQKAIELGIWDVIQLPFNMMDQRQAELFDDAEKKGIGIVVRSVLLKGLLSNRGKNLHPALHDVEMHIEKYNQLLDKAKPNLPSFATKFALSFPEVSSVLIGIDKKEYLEQALDTVNGEYLSKDLLERAKQLAYPDPDFLDLPYWNKMNWLK